MSPLPTWLYRLKLPMPATLGAVNVYLIRGPEGVALIDTGMKDLSSINSLKSKLGELGLRIEDIDSVLCTHHHADHAGLGRTFVHGGAQVMMSMRDRNSLSDFFKYPECDNNRATFFGIHEVPEDFATRVAPMFPFFRGLAEEFEPQVTVDDQEEVSLGGIRFTVHLTPGHTMGHICVSFENELLFSGDCVTSGNATHISMRRDVMGKNPLKQFLNSLQRLGKMNIPTTLPGHGRPITDLSSRTDAIISHHKRRLAQVKNSLSETPRTAHDITSDSAEGRPKTFARWLAMSQTLAYLEYLESLGETTKIETPKGVWYKK